MSKHARHDNCQQSEECYQRGYGEGWRSALDAYMGLRCWCGGEVGPRVPGDPRGVGCLDNVTHDWRGEAMTRPGHCPSCGRYLGDCRCRTNGARG